MSYFVKIIFPSGPKIFGEHNYQIDSGNILGRVKEVSTITRAINIDKSFENSKALIRFVNTDGYFDEIMKSDDRYILKKQIKIFDDKTLIFSGMVSNLPKCPPNEFKIEADVKTAGFDNKVNSVIKKSEFPQVPQENEGKNSNIIGGYVTDNGGNGTGALVAVRVDENCYLAAWHHVSITEIYDSNETEITSSCTVYDENGYTYINYTSNEPELYYNCFGLESNGQVLSNPADILAEIVSRFSNFPITNFEQAQDVYKNRGYSGVAIAITNEMTWREFFRQFSLNFDCYIFLSVDGKLTVKALDWGREAERHVIPKIYVDSNTFENWMDFKGITNEYKRMYWYHYRKSFFHRMPQDIIQPTGWEAESNNIDLRFNKDDLTTRDVTSREACLRKNPIIWYGFSIGKEIAKDIEIGDVVSFQYSRGYYPNQWRLCLITRITYIQNSTLIRFEGMDVNGINESAIILQDSQTENAVKLKDTADSLCNVLL